MVQPPQGPLAVGGQRWVGVRLVDEVAGDGLDSLGHVSSGSFLPTVLLAPWSCERGPAVVDGVEVALFLLLHGRHVVIAGDIGREQRVQEVLVRAVFFEPSDQVGHGNVEVFRVHNGGVQDDRSRDLTHGPGLGGRHTLEHFDIELVLDAALHREFVRGGHRVEVVRGRTDPNGVGVLRLQRHIQEPQVVGVYFSLREVRGLLPVVNFGVHALHGQVRALHNAHLDGRTALVDALVREVDEFVQGIQGVGEVGLKHDAGFQVHELVFTHELFEELDGEVEVFVFLHIHIDEGVRCSFDRFPVQRAEAFLEPTRVSFDVPRVELGAHRRCLDGHVVHLGVAEELDGPV